MDCPEAYEELMKVRLSDSFGRTRLASNSQDIQDAQNDLRAKGVTVD
jgi:hypothetical protein